MPQKWILSFALPLLLISACNNQDQATNQSQVDYQQVKQILIDTIHTQEGKKAIQELLKDPEFQTHMQLQSKAMEEYVAKSIQNQTTQKDWINLLSNPTVAEQIMKATEKQQQETMKILMKDPKFQQSMMDILKDPEFSKQLLEVMKSKENRQETLKLIQETLKTPSFQDELKKKIQETQPTQGQDQGQGQSQGQGQGEEQGGQ
ncbi:spore germination lipoprotein GerD [Risungbinella massiliensis]|uniref:spore germination lipoprotein GerD n=1 Tax=Risungbinella massiliensis TaxID=1329796 RepID=UPI0005CC0D76|nr:spore germination lipoprotein GerD [Risungbinella massiliensis]